VAAKKHKSKKASSEMSALDTLALERAEQILAENGITQTKTASSAEVRRALRGGDRGSCAYEILAANGYVSEE
jgi:hypothetical protein